MTIEEAYKILGLTKVHTQEEIKKRYRTLMMKTHPDMKKDYDYPYDAVQINIAYEFLIKDRTNYRRNLKKSPQKDMSSSSKLQWNAPVNSRAYAPRQIFHLVEDIYGEIAGEAIIDTGYYEWIPDEEFSLFLKSIYLCGNSLLENANQNKEKLPELIYLLAQQYVPTEQILALAREKEGIYSIDAMLELEGSVKIYKGELLIPSRMVKHRLYVRNQAGQELGYISFKDDRFYYGIIPMVERKAIKIKIIVSDDEKNKMNHRIYRQLTFMMIKNRENRILMMETINDQIDKLLYGN